MASTNESFYDTYRTVLVQTQLDFKGKVRKTINAFGSDRRSNELMQSCASLYNSGTDLISLYPDGEAPEVIHKITNAARNAIESGGTKLEESKALTALLQQIVASSDALEILNADTKQFRLDFDEIYRKMYAERRIPELFDQLIELTQKIIESDEIDNISILNSLNKLVEVLKSNRNGSLASVKSASFYAQYLKNVLSGALKKIPGVDVMIDAWEKTIDDFAQMEGKLERELDRETLNVILDESIQSRLTRLPNFGAAIDVEYTEVTKVKMIEQSE